KLKASCFGASHNDNVSSNGLLSHAQRSRCVKRFIRSSATRFDSDQPSWARICKYFRTSIVISAVHTWILTALALVPTNVLIFRFCFSALKHSSICQRSL